MMCSRNSSSGIFSRLAKLNASIQDLATNKTTSKFEKKSEDICSCGRAVDIYNNINKTAKRSLLFIFIMEQQVPASVDFIVTSNAPCAKMGDHIVLLLNDEQFIFTQIKEKG